MSRTILAIDCSTGPASIAIVKDGEVLCEHLDPDGHRQSARLVPAAKELVQANLPSFAAIDLFAVTTGPGGFTGIRIALATARGFALAAEKQVVGISSLETLAWEALMQARDGETATAIINAHRKQVYVQHFQRRNGLLHPATEPQAIDTEQLEPFLTKHNPTHVISTIAQETAQPRAPLAKYAAFYCAALPEHTLQSRKAEALYIRPPDAKPQKSLLE